MQPRGEPAAATNPNLCVFSSHCRAILSFCNYPLFGGLEMDSPIVEIDPNGEVIIFIPAVDVPSELTVTSAATAASLQDHDAGKGECSIQYSEDILKTVLISGREDVDADGTNRRSSLRLKVCQKHLITSSRRAAKMYRMNCKESTPDECGLLHWNFEPIFNPSAFQMVMSIVHAQTQEIPKEVDLDTVADVAAITDDLQCHDAVKFFVDAWMDRLRTSPPNQVGLDLCKWILIASVFDQPELFRSTTRLAILQCTDPLSPGLIPVDPAILGNKGPFLHKNCHAHMQ